MSDDFSTVPRDLASRIEELDDVFEGEYETLVGDVRSLPPREQLPACPLCGEPLQVQRVFAVDSGVAIALRLTCGNVAGHDSGQAITYIFELLTRELYPERREPVADETPSLTLTVEEFRTALDRAAAGESVDSIVSDHCGNQNASK